METIGELLEPITTRLYALRVEIAVVSVIGAAVLAIVAARLGWFAAARRHRARAAALTVAFLAVALPVTWYMASPILLRTSLVEAAPGGISPSSTPSHASPTLPPAPSDPAGKGLTAPPTSPPTSSPVPTPAPTPFQARAVATGEFQGTDEFHFGRGTATIVEVEPGRYRLQLEDFSVRNGPDLFVYLSPDPDGYDDDALELGRLKATDGSFGYALPDGADPTDYESAIIWCKQFAHLFATATLSRA